MSEPSGAAAAIARLDEIAHRLRKECPWDREQDARSIVPHTLEEAYELADAVARDDDGRQLDELGDVLFQVVFLAMLLEERGEGALAAVADHCTEKLIRRHPHVFGEVEATRSEQVRANWDQIKQGEAGREAGIFGEVPKTLPALLYARKVQRRAASAGLGKNEPAVALGRLDQAVNRLAEVAPPDAHAGPTAPADVRDTLETGVGEVLFAAVDAARALKVDPELALRAAADRFRSERETSGAESPPPAAD